MIMIQHDSRCLVLNFVLKIRLNFRVCHSAIHKRVFVMKACHFERDELGRAEAVA
jgi:hypothetical protein